MLQWLSTMEAVQHLSSTFSLLGLSGSELLGLTEDDLSSEELDLAPEDIRVLLCKVAGLKEQYQAQCTLTGTSKMVADGNRGIQVCSDAIDCPVQHTFSLLEK